jgi:hypothetical protein
LHVSFFLHQWLLQKEREEKAGDLVPQSLVPLDPLDPQSLKPLAEEFEDDLLVSHDHLPVLLLLLLHLPLLLQQWLLQQEIQQPSDEQLLQCYWQHLNLLLKQLL